jgi:hypothetical protein
MSRSGCFTPFVIRTSGRCAEDSLSQLRANAAPHKYFARSSLNLHISTPDSRCRGAARFIKGSGATHQMAIIPNQWE